MRRVYGLAVCLGSRSQVGGRDWTNCSSMRGEVTGALSVVQYLNDNIFLASYPVLAGIVI
jgi:hypothetical protein